MARKSTCSLRPLKRTTAKKKKGSVQIHAEITSDSWLEGKKTCWLTDRVVAMWDDVQGENVHWRKTREKKKNPG